MSAKPQKRPNWLLYKICSALAYPFIKMKFNIHVKKSDKLTKPCIILTNHTSNFDFLILNNALFPYRINFLGAYCYFIDKRLKVLLDAIGVISKLQFSNDVASIKKMHSLLHKNNGILSIMPEGTVSGSGELGYIAPQISKIIKFLKVDVFAAVLHGSNLSHPKWAKHGRRTRIEVELSKIITVEEISQLSDADIFQKVKDKLNYNEFDYQQKNNLIVKGKNKAEGLENLLFVCPSCKKEFTLKTLGDSIFCEECHLKATLNDEMKFVFEGKQYFNNYTEWYRFQEEFVEAEVRAKNFVIMSKVKYLTNLPSSNKYVQVGEGNISLDKNGYKYKGSFKGENVEVYDKIENVPIVTFASGKNFELPYRDGIRCFEPYDKQVVMKWSIVGRKIYDLLKEGNNV